MDRFTGLLSDNVEVRLGGGDSASDQLSSRYTVMVLTAFALLVSAKNYFDEPIKCWCPAHFEPSQVEYTNKVCWTSNTYFLPFEVSRIPQENDSHEHISYYQWVGFILIGQACLFYLPRVIWITLSKQSGIAVHTVTDAAVQCHKLYNAEDRAKAQKYMTTHLATYLSANKKYWDHGNRLTKCCLLLRGNYLVFVYILIKILYFTNVVGQLYLLNAFLQTNYNYYGIEVMKKMIGEQNWVTSDRFPRVALCDLKIRLLGNIHRYTIQCALPMNLYNEIIFIVIWFWLSFVAIVTAMSLIYWCGTTFSQRLAVHDIEKKLVCSGAIPPDTSVKVDHFVNQYLRRNGCFVLQLVSKNSSELIAAELTQGLWSIYSKDEQLENLTSDCS